MKTDNEKLKEFLADIDNNILVADGLSHAFIGLSYTANGNVAVYSKELIISNLMKKDSMDFETAEEYMQYNIIGANVGELTPIFVDMIPKKFWK